MTQEQSLISPNYRRAVLVEVPEQTRGNHTQAIEAVTSFVLSRVPHLRANITSDFMEPAAEQLLHDREQHTVGPDERFLLLLTEPGFGSIDLSIVVHGGQFYEEKTREIEAKLTEVHDLATTSGINGVFFESALHENADLLLRINPNTTYIRSVEKTKHNFYNGALHVVSKRALWVGPELLLPAPYSDGNYSRFQQTSIDKVSHLVVDMGELARRAREDGAFAFAFKDLQQIISDYLSPSSGMISAAGLELTRVINSAVDKKDSSLVSRAVTVYFGHHKNRKEPTEAAKLHADALAEARKLEHSMKRRARIAATNLALERMLLPGTGIAGL